MRLDFWLAQPETERTLTTALRLVASGIVLWAAAASYGLWSAHGALATAQSDLTTQSHQLTEIARNLPEKRRQAARAQRVRVVLPDEGGEAEVLNQLASLAQSSGAEVQGIHLGTGGQPSTRTQSGTNSPAGKGETFECDLAGPYSAFSRFLDSLTASPQALDLVSIEVTKTNAKTRTNEPRLALKLTGRVGDAGEKP